MTRKQAMKLLAENSPETVMGFLRSKGVNLPSSGLFLNPTENPQEYKRLIKITKEFFDKEDQ